MEFLHTAESVLMEIEALAALTVPAQCALDLLCAEESALRAPWDHLLIALDRDRLTLSTLVPHRASTLKQPGIVHLLQVLFARLLQVLPLLTALSEEAQLLEAVIDLVCSDLLLLHTLVFPAPEVDQLARVTFPLAEPAPMEDPHMRADSEVT